MFFYIFALILGYLIFTFCSKRVEYPLNMLQLSEYKNDKYKEWIQKNKSKVKSLNYYQKEEEKTPLVWTDRVKRLKKKHDSVNIVLFLLVVFASGRIIYLSGNRILAFLALILMYFLIYYFQYLILILSNKFALPEEVKINQGFYSQAQAKIRDNKEKFGLKVLGITGSFGKTSVKFISNTILKESLRVKNTPSSYNTPMGLSKVINNDLEDDVEVFIAELGAYKPGEIKEVADLVQPDIGIITAIGPTHMQMYKTIENIMKTKYELIESLPKDGRAIFNYDNDYVKKLSDKTDLKKINYGLEDIEKLDVYAKDLEVNERGSKFTLGIKDLGEVHCKTVLLGRHNISNLLAGASAAYALGMGLEEIARGISKVEAVEHRLNLIDPGTGVLVIDDAFNSNPVGFKAALSVIDEFKDYRKFIVTPGMVELGDMEEEENYKIGKEIAKTCDKVLLVGSHRTEPIYKGLKDAGYNMDNVYQLKNLKEATELLGQLNRPGDVVLFENDLPDSYSED
ncbi:UDP-N-acetylmuramoyl-tripeptide--D-alanyl-D-alanine ligase [Peptoniphilus catoniae]|uniref:UDP-N-acetylmuramoyl-tripeptide--D-alanyl-D- alanine ligase n=1 Tax=Peptoniphilus catoniae TaxID=1660341 RepID=UPI0010FDCE41|nr:UDP-N-acetylmuramoyl-tripeptide--D-alanyl-D-alanine ligase [Peptoniphilus catoniae]